MPTLLVIDDDEQYRALVRRMLEDAGHNVRDACSAAAGYDIFHTEALDAVITDILMPDTDGIELITQLNVQAAKELVKNKIISMNNYPFKVFDIDILIDADIEIKPEPTTTVKAISTPGHTWDFMSYWIPEKKILISLKHSDVMKGRDMYRRIF